MSAAEQARQLLAEYVTSLRGAGYSALAERFTVVKTHAVRASVRVPANRECVEIDDAQSGLMHQVEMWCSVGVGGDLHMFVTVYPAQRADLSISEDFIVLRPGSYR
jgi:hypothetical protein